MLVAMVFLALVGIYALQSSRKTTMALKEAKMMAAKDWLEHANRSSLVFAEQLFNAKTLGTGTNGVIVATAQSGTYNWRLLGADTTNSRLEIVYCDPRVVQASANSVYGQGALPAMTATNCQVGGVNKTTMISTVSFTLAAPASACAFSRSVNMQARTSYASGSEYGQMAAISSSSATSSVGFNPFAPTDHIIFVTKTRYNGALGGLAGADAKCTAAARSNPSLEAVRPGATWKAVLSSGSVNARDRISIIGAVRNLNSSLSQVASGPGQFWSNNWSVGVRYMEDCTSSTPCYAHGGRHTWMASNGNGTRMGGSCNDWTSTSGAVGAAGDANTGDDDHSCDGGHCYAHTCNDRLMLYCISQ